MSGNNPIVSLGSPAPSADEFKIYTKKPDVRFLSRAVQPPSQVYVSVGDDIVVSCASSQLNESITVSYRLLRFDGDLVLGQFAIRPPSNRTPVTYQESLAEGFLLSVSCRAAVATTRGQTFVRVFLTDPALGGSQPSYTLFSDYVTTAISPAHPNGRVLAPSEGPGRIYMAVAANPAVGAEFIVTQPANARWRVICGVAALTTSAAAGTRAVRLPIAFGGLTIFKGQAYQGIPPSTIAIVSFGAVEGSGVISPGVVSVPMPNNITLVNFGQINSDTLALNAADLWGAPQFMVEEWLDNV